MLELTRLYQAFVKDLAFYSIAMMTCSVMHSLFLQKPRQQSRAKDHSCQLMINTKDLSMEEGLFDELINKCPALY